MPKNKFFFFGKLRKLLADYLKNMTKTIVYAKGKKVLAINHTWKIRAEGLHVIGRRIYGQIKRI